MKEAPFLNLLSAAWIQFQTHDWVSHGDHLPRDVHRVPVSESDGVRSRCLLREMAIGRTQPDPTRDRTTEDADLACRRGRPLVGCIADLRERLGDAAPARSGSTLTADRGGQPGCPTQSDGIRGDQLRPQLVSGHDILHTLFIKEHNAIYVRLKRNIPTQTARIFNVARLITPP